MPAVSDRYFPLAGSEYKPLCGEESSPSYPAPRKQTIYLHIAGNQRHELNTTSLVPSERER